MTSDRSGRKVAYPTLAITPAPNEPESELVLRLAETDEERCRARELLNKMYAWRGYGDSHQIPAQDTHSTFVALVDNNIAGTITLGVDTPSGLAADNIFRDEIDVFRRMPGASVCELTKLAFDTEMSSRQILAALFHVVFIYGRHRHQCTDLFIEVNPRHRRFYRMMLGFLPIGELKSNPSVDAPAQLMWLRVSDIAAQIAEFAGQGQEAKTRSLYPFFLSRTEVESVEALLARSGLTRRRAHRPNLDLHQTRLLGAFSEALGAGAGA